MTLPQQHSPIFFDLDSPYAQRLRKLSTTSKDPNYNFRLELFPKASQRKHQSNEIPSLQLQRIDSVREQKDSPAEPRLKKRHSQQKRARKVVFPRQHSQPQQISRQNTNPHAASFSNNQNVKKRLTSLERYFEETRSIQLPYRTKNRIYENQKFLTQLQCFQANLSQIKKKESNVKFSPIIEGSSEKRNRWADTRPKKLKIHDLENENVKKEKQRIMVEKIMKQRVEDYRSNMMDPNKTQNQNINTIFQKPVQLSVQIQNLNKDVEDLQMQIKRLKRLKRENQQKMKQVTNFFGFLY